MQYKTINAAVVYEVSVPLRGYGFEIFKALPNMRFFQFPSPCGDVVLKSVPCVWPHQGTLVSVPLRGYGFEMLVYEYEGHYYWEFPSPCGDVVLKLWITP